MNFIGLINNKLDKVKIHNSWVCPDPNTHAHADVGVKAFIIASKAALRGFAYQS